MLADTGNLLECELDALDVDARSKTNLAQHSGRRINGRVPRIGEDVVVGVGESSVLDQIFEVAV